MFYDKVKKEKIVGISKNLESECSHTAYKLYMYFYG